MPSAIVLLSALSLTLQQPNTQNPVDWRWSTACWADRAICKGKRTASAFPAMIFMSQSTRSRCVRVSRSDP